MTDGKQLFFYHNIDTFLAKTRLAEIIASAPDAEITHYHETVKDKSLYNRLISQLSSPSLVVNQQLIVVWNYDWSLKIDQILEIITLIQNNLVFFISANFKKNKKKILAPSTKLKSQPKVELFFNKYLDPKKLTQRIEHYLKKHHLKAAAEVVTHLNHYFKKKINAVEDTESDPVIGDLEKLSLYFKPKEELTIKQVDFIIDELKEERNEFEVIDAFFEKKLSNTLKNFMIFLQSSGNLINLVQRFIFEVTRLLQIKEELTEGKNLGLILENFKLFEFQKKKIIKANSLFQFNALVALFEDLVKIEKILKTDNLVNSNILKKKVNLKAKLAFEKTIILRLKS